MSERPEPPSHLDMPSSSISTETEDLNLLAPYLEHLPHARSQSQLTTISEAIRREWAYVPAPLNLTPKVFQASQFANQPSPKLTRQRTKQPMIQPHASHRMKRFSRLRDVSMANRDDEIEEDYESDVDYVIEYFSEEGEEDEEELKDGCIGEDDEDAKFLTGSSIIPTVEPATRYDDGRNVGLPSSLLLPLHQPPNPLQSLGIAPLSSPRSSSGETRMQRVWNAAQRGKDRASLEILSELERSGSVRHSQNQQRDLEMIKMEINQENEVVYSAAARSSVALTSGSPGPRLTFDEWHALQQAGNVLKNHGLEQSFRTYLALTGIAHGGSVTVAEAQQQFLGKAINNNIQPSQPLSLQRSVTFSAAEIEHPVTQHTHFSEPPPTNHLHAFFTTAGSAEMMPSQPRETFLAESSHTHTSSVASSVNDNPSEPSKKSLLKGADAFASVTTGLTKSFDSEDKPRNRSMKLGLNSLFSAIERPVSIEQEIDSIEVARQAADRERKRKEREEIYAEGPRWVKIIGGLI